MFIASLGRRLAPAFLFAALTLPLSAATPELDPLAREIEAFAASPVRNGATSLKLATQLGWSEKIAHFEADAGKKAELKARLRDLRELLGGAGREAEVANAVTANGIISGLVSDDGAPLPYARISAYSPEGNYFPSVDAGENGRYSLILPPGTYVVYAQPPYDLELSPQLFAGINCHLYNDCLPSDGTPIVLTSGGHRTADFALADLGSIEGQVRARETLAPVSSGIALIYNEQGDYFDSTAVQNGSYAFGGLPPGQYYVALATSGDRVGMIYHDVVCHISEYSYNLTCPRGLGTLVPVALDQVVSGIDFEPYRGATLRGRVKDAVTGAPVTSGVVEAVAAPYQVIRYSAIDYVDGTFEIEGLIGGRYYLNAAGQQEYTAQFYELSNCTGESYCLSSAKPIDVVMGDDYFPFDFALEKRGTLSGRVTDDRTGAPIESAMVLLQPRGSNHAYYDTRTDSAGFFSFSNLPAVDMVLRAEHSQYRGEYFDDVDLRDGPAAAKSIKIVAGQVISGFEMKLARRGRIVGRVFDASNGEPTYCSVVAIPAPPSVEPITYGYCNTAGSLVIDNLLPGPYYVLSFANYPFAKFLYGKGSCNSRPGTADFACDLSEGTAVQVRSGEDTGPLEFPLERSANLEVKVDFQVEGASHLPSGRLRLFESDGDEVALGQLDQPVSFAFFQSLAPGSYRLVLDGSPDWQSFAWESAACSRWYCAPERGAAIQLAPGEWRSGVEFRPAELAPYRGCTPSPTALCLNQGRYEVKATWGDFAGASGTALAGNLTADTGYFYFFSPSNLEVMIKALNGCDDRLGHHFWIYAAGLTNVRVDLQVKDTLNGAIRHYSNGLGNTFRPILDSGAFATCDLTEPPAAGGAPDAVAAAPLQLAPRTGTYCEQQPDFVLCLGGRFKVEAKYRTPDGGEGSGYGRPITADTGAFSFFDFNNLEVVVKLLDACGSGLPGHWVFASGLTDVEVELRIEDLATGRIKFYQQAAGPFEPILDLGSFPPATKEGSYKNLR